MKEYTFDRVVRILFSIAVVFGLIWLVGYLSDVLIGLPMGILLGLLMGILNMVPYLQTLGIIPAFLLAIFKALEAGNSPWMTLLLTGLVLVAVHIVQEWIVAPKIMGKVTGLNPALILLSLSVRGKLLGLLGLIIALPVICLLLAYYRIFLSAAQSRSSA